MTRTEMNMAQGTVEWFKARLGIPTASHFADIVTPTGKPTANAARTTYRNQLLAERMTGQLTDHFTTPAMERGVELEPRARAWYEVTTGHAVRQVGFVQLDTGAGICGASPDGITDASGLEIKCPLPHTIIGQLLADMVPPDYAMQCQAGMWICGLLAWDLVLFAGTCGIPNRLITLSADARLHAAFSEHVPAFCAELDAAESRLVAMGGTARWRDTRIDNAADILGDGNDEQQKGG